MSHPDLTVVDANRLVRTVLISKYMLCVLGLINHILVCKSLKLEETNPVIGTSNSLGYCVIWLSARIFRG